MCGISGYLDIKNGVDIGILEEMTDSIDYRGPDDEGFALINKESAVFARGKDTVKEVALSSISEMKGQDYFLGFGHRRLSILDLSVLGHQPMKKHDKVMVFNGEIYNYIEIREELVKEGYEFVSNCDSEVILSAYDFWGEDCVNKFNGMWAMAIYDLKSHVLFISRDRFGIKPLYYYRDGEKIIFSSEIKQILCDKSVPRIVNEEILVHHLKYNFREYSEDTFFQNIYTLRGGCNLLISFDFEEKRIGEVKKYRYYDLQEKVKVQYCDDSSRLIGDALRKAIMLRMRSDVKVGSCLSGGLDSSSIVGIVCDELTKKGIDPNELTTVSIGFPNDKAINELNYCQEVADYCHCKNDVLTPNINDVLSHLENIVWHQDEPLPHLGAEVSYAVFKGASDNNCEVFFDGQGGDEGLVGYYVYYANYLWNTLKKGGVADFVREMKKIVGSSSMSYKMALVYMIYFNIPWFREMGVGIRRNKYLSRSLKRKINKKKIETFFEQKDGLERQIEDYLYGSLPCILHWEDRNSMASSVETRLPFLDYEYVETVLSVELTEKLEMGYTKVPLRKYVKNLLPESVVWRKNKLGFPAPTERWFKEIPRDYFLDLMDNAKCNKYFNLKRMKREYLAGKGNVEMMEKFILVELWMREFDLRSA